MLFLLNPLVTKCRDLAPSLNSALGCRAKRLKGETERKREKTKKYLLYSRLSAKQKGE